MRRVRNRGFTLIELLVVVAIIGVLAGIAIYNYLLALQRAKQKRTMEDMRTIAQAWEAKGAETHGYNAAGFNFPGAPVTADDLDQLLVPTFAKSLPKFDGWSRPFGYGLDQPIGGGSSASAYSIRSMGADAKFDGATYTPGTTNSFDCDIVYANGSFVTYPER